MIFLNGVRMYTAFERKSLITKSAAFTEKVLAAVFVVHETERKFRGQAVKTSGKTVGCSLPLSARNCASSPLADRLTTKKKQKDFSLWAAEVTAVTALPLGRALGEPTVLCSRMDESIIVGYYTFAKVHPRSLRPSQIPSERSMTYGKK